jgi:UDP-N-acetylglucosamine 4,6-dehydratase
MRVLDLAKAIAPESQIEVVGVRPGEKLHEVLISEDEARAALELETMFVVQPASGLAGELWFGLDWQARGRPLPAGYRYASDTNSDWLDIDQIREILAPIEADYQQGIMT